MRIEIEFFVPRLGNLLFVFDVTEDGRATLRDTYEVEGVDQNNITYILWQIGKEHFGYLDGEMSDIIAYAEDQLIAAAEVAARNASEILSIMHDETPTTQVSL